MTRNVGDTVATIVVVEATEGSFTGEGVWANTDTILDAVAR